MPTILIKLGQFLGLGNGKVQFVGNRRRKRVDSVGHDDVQEGDKFRISGDEVRALYIMCHYMLEQRLLKMMRVAHELKRHPKLPARMRIVPSRIYILLC
jgi:hypothetical protein